MPREKQFSQNYICHRTFIKDIFDLAFLCRYTPYNTNGDLNVYTTEKYTPNVYTYTPPAMATFDLGSTTDFVDSTTFDQRQPIDTLPDTNGLLSTTVSPATITNNSHLGTERHLFWFLFCRKAILCIASQCLFCRRIISKDCFGRTRQNLFVYHRSNRWHDEEAARPVQDLHLQTHGNWLLTAFSLPFLALSDRRRLLQISAFARFLCFAFCL